MSLTIFRCPVMLQNDGYTDSWSTGLVVSTDALGTLCKEIFADPGMNETYILECSFTGFIVSNGQSVFIRYTAMAKNIGGTISIYNAGNDPMLLLRDGDDSLDSCYVTIDSSGNYIQIKLFGLPADTINWGISYRIIRYVH